MNIKKSIQQEVSDILNQIYGETSLKYRMQDITQQCNELVNANNINTMKHKLGNLLLSCYALADESGWDAEELILTSLNPIIQTYNRYDTCDSDDPVIRVGLFGGAFNPITNGHIKSAIMTLNETDLDEVWFVPCNIHAFGKDMASGEDRIKMCELAIKEVDDPRLKVYTDEIRLNMGASTYENIKTIFKLFKNKGYLFSYIIGADNADKIWSWKNGELLKQLLQFIIVPRQGYQLTQSWYCRPPHIVLPNAPMTESISSTMVRKELQHDVKRVDLVPKNVLEYILDKKLYGVTI